MAYNPELFLDQEFWGIITHSAGFWITFGGWILACVLTAGIGLMLMFYRCRYRNNSLPCWHHNQSGSAAALDMALTMPIFFFIMVLVVQFALFANTALVVHYAAFSAARSARVLNCNPLIKFSCKSGDYQTAARYALIAVSPSTPNLACRSCDVPTSVLQALIPAADYQAQEHAFQFAGISLVPNNTQAIINKARYAFDPDNVTVETDNPLLAYLNKDFLKKPKMVKATVSYKAHIFLPVGRILGEQRSDGKGFYKKMTAEVTLL